MLGYDNQTNLLRRLCLLISVCSAIEGGALQSKINGLARYVEPKAAGLKFMFRVSD